MTTPKKATTVNATVKPKVQSKPKPFEVGYEFNIKAKIKEVHPEDDQYNYPFIIQVDLGNYEEWEDDDNGLYSLHYESKQELLNVISKSVPTIQRQIKQDELNKAKADVARLTKELAVIK